MTIQIVPSELLTWTRPPDPLAWALAAASTLSINDDEARVAIGIFNELVRRYRFADLPLERREREGEAVGGKRAALRVVVNPLVSPK